MDNEKNNIREDMNALVMEGLNRLVLRKIPVPKISAEDILIKIDSCAICGSDIRIIKTGSNRIKYPVVLGHEICGTIVKVGQGQREKFKIGEKICLGADIPCGYCEWCKRGLTTKCKNNIAFGYEYPGGFTEYLKLNKRIIDFGPVVILPKKDLNPDEFSLAEPLGCCINGLMQCSFEPGKTVLIFGAGPVGILMSKLARFMGASKIVQCDIDLDRLEMAKISGSDHYTLFSKEGLDIASKEINNGDGFDIILVACPSIDAQEQSFRYIKVGGVINFFGGLSQNERNLSVPSNIIHYKEISVIGSRGSSPQQHKIAVEMILNKKIIVKDLISKKYRLDEISSLINEIYNKRNIKIIINP